MAGRFLHIAGCVGLPLVLAQCAKLELPELKIPEVKIPEVSIGGSGSPCDPSIVPKQSQAATECLYLASNENCEFFVDGKPMIKGKLVRMLVTNESHRIVCKPDGYRPKEDLIHPPFDPYHPARFTFLIEDRLLPETQQ